MIHRLEVTIRAGQPDPAGQAVLERVRRFTRLPVEGVRTCAVYAFDEAALPEGALAVVGAGRSPGYVGTKEALRALATDLFTDPIVNACALDGESLARGDFDWYVEVGFRPGVTDNVGRTAGESLGYRLGAPLREGHQVHAATGYFLRGRLTREQVEGLAREWLANELIQQVLVLAPGEVAASRLAGTSGLFRLPRVELTAPVRVERIPLPAEPVALAALSQARLLALTAEELATIRAHFARPEVIAARATTGLGPEPTDVELEVLAQTWSEHCKHKIFNAEIAYTDEAGRREVVRSLFKTYIQGATARVRAALGADDWCLSVFTDNAGVVRFDGRWGFVFKVETHNSPSALDPYGGALTGIVGVNRDPFGTGRGAELLFNTDVFCFAPPFYEGPLPAGLLHPRRIYEGVRLGVEHGGNKSGVPTVNGSVTFDESYLGKPLVFCGTGGLLPLDLGGQPGWRKWVQPGDAIVMVGGRIGKDGIHGATFSSIELNEAAPVGAVQIGDPIVQKKMFDFLLVARDRGLYNAITDNGAGGLSSSVGEMAELCGGPGSAGGAVLRLDCAPLKYPGLLPWEIFVSESQERMTLAVPPAQVEALLALSRAMDVEASVLGAFNASGVLEARYGGEVVARLEMEFLHHGLPPMKLDARWSPPPRDAEARPPEPADLGAVLLRLLGRLDICSKESIVRRYDHEVQGASVVKPLVGAANDGPSDAAVLRPLLGSTRGIAIAHGLCPRYSAIDTYAMAANALDEAVRNAIAVGADPARIAGLDNFCWCDPLPSAGIPDSNPDAAHKLAQLVRAARAVHDVAIAYGVPLISGKDSMKNDYVSGGRRLSILPTLLCSVVGIVPDVRRALTMDAKAPGDLVYLVGETREELGASQYYRELGCPGGALPQVFPERARRWYAALGRCTAEGLLSAAHDCSDGGLAVALAEMAFAGGFGMELDLGPLAAREQLAPAALLFSESASRLVVTVRPEHAAAFERELAGLPCHRLGTVAAHDRLAIRSGATVWLDLPLARLKEAWQAPLREL
ncbi:MAG: phosphoribosylformylglycinamidine synthase [Candidatus Lambdaproteobacteria bacterium]|nr:phosphoribosylformylglycinamidine synthase [Candidatus Lambdaproteobacteria bacterium]